MTEEEARAWIRQHLKAVIGKRMADVRESEAVRLLGLGLDDEAIGDAAERAVEALIAAARKGRQ